MRMVQVNPDELPANQTVDIRDLMDMVWRRKWLIMFVTLVFTALAAGYSYTRIPEYTSTATVLVRPILTNPLETNPIEQVSVQTELRIATSAAVGQVAADKLGQPRSAVPDLIDNVSVSSPEETQILEISYAGHGRKEAQEGAQAFAEAYLEFKSKQAIDTISEYTSKLQTSIQQVTTQISDLNNRIVTTPRRTALWQDLLNRRTSLEATRLALQNQLTTLSSLNVDAGQVIQPALLPLAPSSPNHELDLALGVILGLVIGVAIASIDERARQRRPSEVMLEQYLEAPILGAIPKSRVTLSRLARPAIIGDPRGRAAESYLLLRTNLLAVNGSRGDKTVMITSGARGEGKTTTAVNLSAALAQMGKEVILVSADLRNPRLHSFFGIPNTYGLIQILRGETGFDDALHKTMIPRLRVLPSGPPSSAGEPVEQLQSDLMLEVLARCTEAADVVVIDSAPVLPVADSLVLAPVVDGVLFVADARKATRDAIVQCRYQLSQVGGRIIGGVLTGIAPRSSRIHSYESRKDLRQLFHRIRKETSAEDGVPEPNGSKPMRPSTPTPAGTRQSSGGERRTRPPRDESGPVAS
jgi:capsular exopolysaccharide synthesis family protein